jgi:hypothetical protein
MNEKTEFHKRFAAIVAELREMRQQSGNHCAQGIYQRKTHQTTLFDL